MDDTEELSSVFTAAARLVSDNRAGRFNASNIVNQQGNGDGERFNWLAALPSDAKNLIGMFVGNSDAVTELTLVSRYSFPPSEEVYKFLCRLTMRKGFFWGGTVEMATPRSGKTWLDAAKNRKRLRVNGFYCLKEMVTRPPNNDAFWEERKVKSVETIHYRHFRFLDDGVVLYAINTHSLWENPFGLEMKIGATEAGLEKEIVSSWFTEAKKRRLRDDVRRGFWSWGDEKGDINVTVCMPYCELSFSFTVLNGEDSYGNYHGNSSVLQCTRHEQVCSDGSRTAFTLPINHDFIFHRRDYFSSDDSLVFVE